MRDYYTASMRQMFMFARKAEASGKPAQHLPRLSDGQFRKCAERAKAGALRLMELCSNYSQDQLWNGYVRFCSGLDLAVGNPWLQTAEAEAEDGAEDLLSPVQEAPASSSSSSEAAASLLTQCKAYSELEAEGLEIPASRMSDDATRRLSASRMPDARQLAELGCDDSVAKDVASPVSSSVAKTLWESLEKCETANDMWPCLFSLSVFLRYGRGGCDSKILPNPNCRRLSSKLNWHQLAEREASLINKQLLVTACRTSRMAAWRSLASECCAAMLLAVPGDCAKGLQPPVSLQKGSVVMALPPMKPACWEMVLITMVWRTAVKNRKRTAFLASRSSPVPMEQVECFRGYILAPDHQEAGLFTCSETSFEIRLLPTCVAFEPQLECSPSSRQDGKGVVVKLHGNAVMALEHVKKLDVWPDEFKKDEAASSFVSSSVDAPTSFFGGLARRARESAPVSSTGALVHAKRAKKETIFKACKKMQSSVPGPAGAGSMPEHFGRSMPGRAAIRAQLQALAEMERRLFNAPSVKHDNTVDWTVCRAQHGQTAAWMHIRLFKYMK